MRILVLDDDQIVVRAPESYYVDPHDYREDEFVQTKDVPVFVHRFFREEWDEVWIDHDLGNLVPTGRTATHSINYHMLGADRKPVSNPKILITTMNVSAARTMADDLARAGLNVHIVPISFLNGQGISRGEVI